nr:MAG: putative cysteine protease [Lake Baikal virophage 14]
MSGIKMNEVLQRMRTNITDLDLERYFPETNHYKNNVIKYSELANFKSIEEILPNNRSYKIILIEDNYNSGHWTCLLRYDDTIEWFDSYGLQPDGELKFINVVKRRLLGEGRRILSELLSKVKDKKVVYNNVKLQKLNNQSTTCGRWVILRILMMKNFFYDLKEFQDFIKKYKKEIGLGADELVAYWIV